MLTQCNQGCPTKDKSTQETRRKSYLKCTHPCSIMTTMKYHASAVLYRELLCTYKLIHIYVT